MSEYYSQRWHEQNDEAEKRMAWRVPTGRDCAVQFKKGTWFPFSAMAHAKDISLGGIRFVSEAEFKQGEKLQIQLNLSERFPGIKKIKIGARVVHSENISPKNRGGRFLRSTGCRLEFSEEMFQEAIRQFMWWRTFENENEFNSRTTYAL